MLRSQLFRATYESSSEGTNTPQLQRAETELLVQ